jgi:ParB-like chromosome segregation protein Spo0J
MAARKLGLDEVPCIRLTNLTEAQKKAYIIADNKLALNAGWDDEMLKVELTELKDLDFDLGLTGFDMDELGRLMSDVNFEPATEDEQGKLDELDPKWICCPKCGSEFDARQA